MSRVSSCIRRIRTCWIVLPRPWRYPHIGCIPTFDITGIHRLRPCSLPRQNGGGPGTKMALPQFVLPLSAQASAGEQCLPRPLDETLFQSAILLCPFDRGLSRPHRQDTLEGHLPAFVKVTTTGIVLHEPGLGRRRSQVGEQFASEI